MPKDLHRNATASPPHAITLANGRTLGPGEDAVPDLKSPHDVALVEAGDLIPVDKSPAKTRGADKKEQNQ